MRLRGSNCSMRSMRSMDFGLASGYMFRKFTLCTGATREASHCIFLFGDITEQSVTVASMSTGQL